MEAKLSILLALGLIGLSGALDVLVQNHCDQVYPDTGISEGFNENIAHAVHSMTVQGLRLFNPKVTEDNGVPTVNLNVSASNLVMPNAPDDPIGSDFYTDTMNMIDRILSQIGRSDDGLGAYWNPVERVAHVFHMWDLWYRVFDEYKDTVLDNPPKQELCNCLTDTAHNGIRDSVLWVAEHYKSGTPITLLNRPIPDLTDATSWEVWKWRLLHYYDDDAIHDAAVYIYCVVKDFK